MRIGLFTDDLLYLALRAVFIYKKILLLVEIGNTFIFLEICSLRGKITPALVLFPIQLVASFFFPSWSTVELFPMVHERTITTAELLTRSRDDVTVMLAWTLYYTVLILCGNGLQRGHTYT